MRATYKNTAKKLAAMKCADQSRLQIFGEDILMNDENKAATDKKEWTKPTMTQIAVNLETLNQALLTNDGNGAS